MKNFIKHSFIRFKKSKIHHDLEKEILSTDLKSKKWYDNYKQAVSSGNDKKVKNLSKYTIILEEDELVKDLINQFTLSTMKRRDFVDICKKLIIEHGFKDIQIENDNMKIILPNEKVIDVYKFDKRLGFEESMPVLKTSDREHQCRPLSLIVSRNLLELGVKNNIVTGYVHQLSSKAKYLHTWVEFDEGKQTYVIDPTLNAVVDKNGYYAFNNITEVNKIASTRLKKDAKMFAEMTEYDELLSVLYLKDRERAKEIYKSEVENQK